MTENFETTYESSIPNQEFWENDGISLTGNPNSSPDMMVLGSRLPGGLGDDHISFNFNPPSTLNLKMTKKTNHLYKYSEDKILDDIRSYVTTTYSSHYCGRTQEYQNIQTIDLMAAKELASPFCQANIIKYGSRYGDKDGRSKRDLLKVIHYAMLLLHFDGHYSRKDNGLTEFSR